MPLSKASRPRDVSDEDQSNDSGVYDEYLSEDEGEEGGLEALNERRVAQWVDEDELEEGVDHEEESSSAESEASDEIVSLKKGLSELPFGAILKARETLKKTQSDSEDSEDEDSNEDISEAEGPSTRRFGDREEQKEKKERREIEHRSNKHAPTAMSSKRPVTRRRQVVEVHKVKARDPRFSAIGAPVSTEQFQKQYGFLSEMHKGELAELKANLARAQKHLANSPRHLREEREREVERLERAWRRTESIVNREKRERAEMSALEKIKKEEKEKRKDGKGGWWLKDSEKKEIRARARLEVIAKEGGNRAVKKALEKKQKKIGQKEKKSRPFAPPARPASNAQSEGESFSKYSRKRPRDAGWGERPKSSKRPRADR